MADKVREVISRNTRFAFGRQLLSGLVFLFVTPYAISKLGAERYGVWALTSAMLGYAALGDLGVRAAFKKYVAQYYAVGERDRILRIIGDGLAYYSALGVIPALLALAFRRPILSAFNVDAAVLPEAEPLLLLMTLVFLLENITNVFCGVVEGLQRMEVSNSIFVGQSALLGLGWIVALATGNGLVGMGTAALAASAAAASAMFIAAQRVTRMGLAPWRLKLSRAVFKELFAYGVKLQGSAIAMVGNLHLDKLLLARFWGLEYVAVYEVALRAALVFRQVPALVVSALVPAVSDLSARNEAVLLRKIYERGARYVAVAGVPLAVIALIYADDLIAAWIGSESFGRAAGLLRLLAVAHCTAIMIDAPFAVARGLGALRFELTTGLIHPLAHLALGLFLVPALGLWGAGIAHASVVISIAIGAAYWTHRGLGLSNEPFLRFYGRALGRPIRATVVAAAFAIPVYLLAAGLFSAVSGGASFPPGEAAGRLGLFVELGVSGGIFVLTYIAAILRSGAVSVRDVDDVPVLGRLLSTKPGRWVTGEESPRMGPGPREART